MKIGIGAGVGPVFLVILVIFVALGYKRMRRGNQPCKEVIFPFTFFLSFKTFPFCFSVLFCFVSILYSLYFQHIFLHKLISSFLLGYEPYATLHFDKIISIKPWEKPIDSAKPDVASVHPRSYANLNEDRQPLPGACRGIILYQKHYVNMTSLNKPYYAQIQLFSSITLDWLRNAWGQVDELGKHVYDALCRGMKLLLPYAKLEKIKDDSPRNHLGAIDENGYAEYDQFDHRPAVLLPGD